MTNDHETKQETESLPESELVSSDLPEGVEPTRASVWSRIRSRLPGRKKSSPAPTESPDKAETEAEVEADGEASPVHPVTPPIAPPIAPPITPPITEEPTQDLEIPASLSGTKASFWSRLNQMSHLKKFGHRLKSKLRRGSPSEQEPEPLSDSRSDSLLTPEPTVDPIIESPRTGLVSRFTSRFGNRFRSPLALGSALGGSLGTSVSSASLASFAEKSTEWLKRQDAGLWGRLFTVMASTYFLADLSVLLIETNIPDPPRAKAIRRGRGSHRARTVLEYNQIFSRNLFNSKGLIPGEGKTEKPKVQLDGPAVKTTLPVDLVGTVIFRDPVRSLGTISHKTDQHVYPVRQGDEIPGLLRVTAVENRRVIFINLKNNRKEFAALPEDGTFSPVAVSNRGGSAPSDEGIAKVSDTQFNISRNEVDGAMKDLNKILTQARAVPNFENGVPAGYKLFQIKKDSIFDKLGLRNGDVIRGVNGDEINDPGKAFELLGELKNSNHVEIQIKRNGRVQTMTYDVN